MQLTNIARDVGEDARRGRVYLPDEVLSARGTSRDEVLALAAGNRPPGPGLRQAIADVLELAERHYQAADRGIPFLPPRCQLAIRSARLIYSAIGARVMERGGDSLTARATVPLWRKLALVARAWAMGPGAMPAAPTRGPHDDLLLGCIREVDLLA
jgi:phytoene synthase